MSALRNALLREDIGVSGWGESPSWGEGAMVLAPASGRWHSLRRAGAVEPGEVLGEIRLGGESTRVTSPYRATVLDVLAHDGHPVEPGRPLVWVELGGQVPA